jgi:pimeloyl-ACP methyl ester carboxylesterase
MGQTNVGSRLAAVGIAVFGYDKPGCGESSGDWTRLTFAGRAVEAVAAVAAVATQPEIDAGRLGLLGGSQGGWIASLAANIDGSIKTIVTFSGRGVSVAESEEYQVEAEGVAEGYTSGEIAEALALYQRVLGRLCAGHAATAILTDESTYSVPGSPNWPRSPAYGGWSSSPASPTATRSRRWKT